MCQEKETKSISWSVALTATVAETAHVKNILGSGKKGRWRLRITWPNILDIQTHNDNKTIHGIMNGKGFKSRNE